MTPIVYVDLLMRGAGIGILALLFARFITRKPLRFFEVSFAVLVISVIVYILASSPVKIFDAGMAGIIFNSVPVISPFLLWWAGLAFFDDNFKPKLWHGVLAAIVLLPVFAPDEIYYMEYVRTIAVVGMYAHLIYVALKTGPSDLVEQRRRFRRWFIVFAVFFGVVVELMEVSLADHSLPQSLAPFQAAGLLLLAGVFAFWSLQMTGPVWTARQGSALPLPVAKKTYDDHLLGRLQLQMDEGIWRQEGLTVGALAARLQVPEHQVRRAINGGLGYRNFSAFVNERRIEEACIALADSERAATSILSIAFEVGFSSIGPFNRAFRQIKGVSPGDFRRQTPRGNG